MRSLYSQDKLHCPSAKAWGGLCVCFCECACTVAFCIRSCMHLVNLQVFVLAPGVSVHVFAGNCACTHMYQRGCVCSTMCVCLTKFVSIFSSSADSTSQHLDVFAAGAAVELVDPVVSPTHGVSHLRLVLHMHTEVDPIHTKYLLRTHIHTHTQVMNRLIQNCMYYKNITCPL